MFSISPREKWWTQNQQEKWQICRRGLNGEKRGHTTLTLSNINKGLGKMSWSPSDVLDLTCFTVSSRTTLDHIGPHKQAISQKGTSCGSDFGSTVKNRWCLQRIVMKGLKMFETYCERLLWQISIFPQGLQRTASNCKYIILYNIETPAAPHATRMDGFCILKYYVQH